MTNKVFVYGTLKRGNRTRGMDMMGQAQFIAEAVTVEADYSLYDLGSFPAVSRIGENRIAGEVWEVDDEMMKVLDNIEGYPNFYNRSVVTTTEGDAWMYHIDDVAQTTLCIKVAGGKEQTLSWNK
jgi:gamma-glutamylcyclotransferase (GGCT)/AIG2-like uncharacterized protein YtfP